MSSNSEIFSSLKSAFKFAAACVLGVAVGAGSFYKIADYTYKGDVALRNNRVPQFTIQGGWLGAGFGALVYAVTRRGHKNKAANQSELNHN
jgi:hypothetical protein